MIHKIGIDKKVGNSKICILYPGSILSGDDTGLGTIGRIDHANIPGGITIKMHPHSNDDILSYFRTGKAIHTDSQHNTAEVSRNKLMLMQAGKIFYHEEEMPQALEGLQIFIRPQHKDDSPKVSFWDLNETDSINQWRLLASPENTTPLQFTSETWIYDITLTSNETFTLPDFPQENLTVLLYVFQGKIELNNQIQLTKEESVIIQNETVSFTASPNTELVLFYTNETSNCFKGGMFSGNQFKL